MIRASTLHLNKEICPGYRLGRLRGRGAFGSVWEAYTPEAKRVALKFLPCGDNNSAAQEIRAIQMVKQFRHPHLVRIEQVWCHRGYVVVTMELADGSLMDLLEAYRAEYQSCLSAHDVCQYLRPVAEALDFLNCRRHQIGGQQVAIQHCDVKPTNILVFGEKAKLSDFGLASATTAPLTPHRRAGTLDYAAPEVFQGKLTDWTDQFALAVSYCQLRGGCLPFPETPRGFSSSYTRPAPNLGMLTSGERAIVERALAPAPRSRWPSCVQFVQALTSVLK